MNIDERLYREMSDEELRARVVANRKKLALHQRKVTQHQTIVTNIQAELDRRELAAYWEAHPDVR